MLRTFDNSLVSHQSTHSGINLGSSLRYPPTLPLGRRVRCSGLYSTYWSTFASFTYAETCVLSSVWRSWTKSWHRISNFDCWWTTEESILDSQITDSCSGCIPITLWASSKDVATVFLETWLYPAWQAQDESTPAVVKGPLVLCNRWTQCTYILLEGMLKEWEMVDLGWWHFCQGYSSCLFHLFRERCSAWSWFSFYLRDEKGISVLSISQPQFLFGGYQSG